MPDSVFPAYVRNQLILGEKVDQLCGSPVDAAKVCQAAQVKLTEDDPQQLQRDIV
jgi:hypothetical protein